MTARNDVDTLLRAWMTDVADGRPRRGRACVGHGTGPDPRQHPTWLARLRVGPTAVWVAPWARYSGHVRLVQLAVLVLALLLLGIAALLAGHRGPPPPFGPAANGILAFDAGGQILVRDLRPRSRADADRSGRDGGSAPVCSHDGRRLAYWAPEGGGGFALVIGRADGTRPVQIPVEPAVLVDVESPLAWAPGGDRIAFVAKEDGAARVYAVPD